MDSLDIMFLISVCFCLPLTMAVSCWVFFVVRREQVPITYYTNLLISNLFQFSMMIIILIVKENPELALYHYISLGIFCCAAFANLDFKMCIATERCLVITRPQWNCIRQTKGSVLLSVLVWILSIISGFLVAFFDMILLPEIIFFALVPFFLFVFTLVWTLKTLPAATSVPTEEKQRIVGILVLLLVNHCLMFLPLIIFYIVPISLYFLIYIPIFLILVNLFLFNPFMDVILVFLMWKDPIDNQLLSLCCYTAGEVAADKKLQLQCCSDCNSTVLYTALQQM
ncbi:mas-related G-protein coupled receptor member B5-like [Simochromis diagramma]|uniref:mas-related G-protein coupled receptor member B5-like n=1 Tax=Simochromis diagramma TaxID=43689 RepID=UPI001A7E25F6|nr:mas-related G-protein coupled receptor member B5-like [Simochromis diagramma]